MGLQMSAWADAYKQLKAGMPEKNEGENENGDKGRKTVFGEGNEGAGASHANLW